jgi:2-amino-4-hydroxy-6-hydroxymethyldihydropteridine diphosphokinase
VSQTVYIGLGSNAGDREQNLFSAVEALRHIDAVAVVRCSSLYDTEPVGPAQPRFLNAAVQIGCSLEPNRLLGMLKTLETHLGREPSDRWGPRAIDMDILFWEGRIVADANLQIPHLELHNRRFALEPLCELAPDAEHPILGRKLSTLLSSLGPQGVTKLEGAPWHASSVVAESGGK